jgi:serine/threonine-protein kinase
MEIEKGTLIGAKYRVKKKIMPGGASTVYHVIQEGLGIDRALKLFDPHILNIKPSLFERTFEEEIKILSMLTHKNIVRILVYGNEVIGSEKRKYFDMEYIEGGNLREIAAKVDDPETLLRLFDEILDALCYIHQHNVLHCDIKPENILIYQPPDRNLIEAKMSDLGVAKPLGPFGTEQLDLSLESEELTYFFGTLKYAPAYALSVIRKLYIHNLGHAVLGYVAHVVRPDKKIFLPIWQENQI